MSRHSFFPRASHTLQLEPLFSHADSLSGILGRCNRRAWRRRFAGHRYIWLLRSSSAKSMMQRSMIFLTFTTVPTLERLRLFRGVVGLSFIYESGMGHRLQGLQKNALVTVTNFGNLDKKCISYHGRQICGASVQYCFSCLPDARPTAETVMSRYGMF